MPSREVTDIAEEVANRLGAIWGYCELAKMKGESGEALDRRMNAAIETIAEASALCRQLLAACRRQA
jgi:hypothetical protein